MDRSESGPALQYKYGDDITGANSNIVGVKSHNQNIVGVRPNRPKLKQKSPFMNRDTLHILPSNSHCFSFECIFSFFFGIPNFCLDRPFGFSIHQEYIYIFSFACPLFLPGSPFRVFNPPGRSFLPKPPFQVFSLASPFSSSFSLFQQ